MGEPTAQLSRIRRVNVRDVWPGEATHFTPWLADKENLDLLGDAIGLQLELEGSEESVGPFRADILCKDTSNDTWVLVENQLERTDHVHMGQVLTYAAGLKAVTIVWIARRFTEEHRAALDWLNEITDQRFNFFGLEVELWRIDDSPVAPRFNVVSRPNEWSRTVSEGASRVSGELTESKKLHVAFWSAFREFVSESQSSLKPTKALPQNWMYMAIGTGGFRLSAVASLWDSVANSYDSHELRAELVIDGPESLAHFNRLAEDRDAIESDLGFDLTWYSQEDVRARRLYARRTADIRDETSWPEYFGWLVDHLEAIRRVFADRVALVRRESS